MRRTLVRLGLLGLLIGIVGGVIAAIAIPRGESASVPPAKAVREEAARAQPSGESAVMIRRTGPISNEIETADPGGGPTWAVRSFLAERRAWRAGRTHVISRARCLQLGRIYRGQFGWIDAQGVFRPATIGSRGAPITCGSRRPDLNRTPSIAAFQTIVGPAGGPTRLDRSVVWGIAGSAARSVDLRDGRRALSGPHGRRRAVLVVEGPKLDPTAVRIAVRYPTGVPVVRGGVRSFRWLPPGRPQPAVVPARGAPPMVAARAADPNGGLPYGLLGSRSSTGGWCVRSQPGRIVDGRVGDIDFERGTFVPHTLSGMDCASTKGLSRDRPTTGGYGGAEDGSEPSRDPTPGRIARRTLPGLQFVAGQALPNVRAITIKTPRDVRTLVPSQPAHAYLAVYDGTFASGSLRQTVTFDDGTSVRTSFPLAF